MNGPNRWMHLRHEDGFTDALFASFRAHCSVFKAYVEAVLDSWSGLPLVGRHQPPPRYVFFEPELSEDRRTATLPLGGQYTLGSRAVFEDEASKLLWQFFPLEFILRLEEGLTETIDSSVGPQTYWRSAVRPVGE